MNTLYSFDKQSSQDFRKRKNSLKFRIVFKKKSKWIKSIYYLTNTIKIIKSVKNQSVKVDRFLYSRLSSKKNWFLKILNKNKPLKSFRKLLKIVVLCYGLIKAQNMFITSIGQIKNSLALDTKYRECRLFLCIFHIQLPSSLLNKLRFTHVRYCPIHKNKETFLSLLAFFHSFSDPFLDQILDLCEFEIFESEEPI